MRIEFTKHYTRRKTERNDYILPSNNYRETTTCRPSVEQSLRWKGKWYYRQTQDGLLRTYCILNNLEVYCGIVIDNEEDPYILITTYYPYSSKIKKKLFPRGRENFERFDIEAPLQLTFPNSFNPPA